MKFFIIYDHEEEENVSWKVLDSLKFLLNSELPHDDDDGGEMNCEKFEGRMRCRRKAIINYTCELSSAFVSYSA